MSDDLISRKRALNALYGARMYVRGLRSGKTLLTEYATQCREAFINLLQELPAADAQYVKHGTWITVGKTPNGARILRCSSCGIERKGIGKSAYCRDCGAKMDLLDMTPAEVDTLLKMDHGTVSYLTEEDCYDYEDELPWFRDNPHLKKENV